MKKFRFVVACTVAWMSLTQTATQAAEERGVQLALVPTIQRVDANYEFIGARFNLIGDNKRVTGADLGLVNMTDEVFKGAGLGILNYSRQETYGCQLGLFNHAGMLKGAQLGLINNAYDLRGVQVGLLLNRSDSNRMLQLGLINIAENAGGWQFGLFNINTYYNAGLPAMIFVNGSF